MVILFYLLQFKCEPINTISVSVGRSFASPSSVKSLADWDDYTHFHDSVIDVTLTHSVKTPGTWETWCLSCGVSYSETSYVGNYLGAIPHILLKRQWRWCSHSLILWGLISISSQSRSGDAVPSGPPNLTVIARFSGYPTHLVLPFYTSSKCPLRPLRPLEVELSC